MYSKGQKRDFVEDEKDYSDEQFSLRTYHAGRRSG
jgi:hypothetical protein